MPEWITWLFPDQASTIAPKVDWLYLALILVTGSVALLIFTLITVYSIRYRRRRIDQRGAHIEGFVPLELFWAVIPFLIFMGIFAWGGVIYYERSSPPKGTIDIYVVGKQWMWKLQHLEGPREINQLHIPAGYPVRLLMTSQDVIHSFYVPAFRIKQDVLPGRYTSQWFQATKPGRYHLFCAEYCGTEHSRMIGTIEVMRQEDFQQWIEAQRATQPMKSSGKEVFARLGCDSCHSSTDTPLGPSLHNVYQRKTSLKGGGSIIADESYLRESILNPADRIVHGYQSTMPTYRGQISDEQLNELIEYIKSLKR